jgi:hypothetical protein
MFKGQTKNRMFDTRVTLGKAVRRTFWMSKVLTSSALAIGCLVWASSAHAIPGNGATSSPIFLTQIDNLTLDPTCAADDEYCGGTILAAGETVVIPRNLLIDLPANRLTLKQIFRQAPPTCQTNHESGLASSDHCNGGVPGYVTIVANRTRCGQVVAGDVFIQKGITTLQGDVTFINYDEGWFRVNGTRGDARSGIMVRFNDPAATQTIQHGQGCGTGPNCSPDTRFTGDPQNYTFSFLTGYPACIPSTNGSLGHRTQAGHADGSGDPFCPASNRSDSGSGTSAPVAADSHFFAPLVPGDTIPLAGNYESVDGVTFLSAHTAQIQVGLTTRDEATQPDYLQVATIVWDLGPFDLGRVRWSADGQATLSAQVTPMGGGPGGFNSDIDIFALRVDPRNNSNHEDPIASTANNPGTNGLGTRLRVSADIWKVAYEVTLPPLAQKPDQPCSNLRSAGFFADPTQDKCPQGGTLAENFSILAPVAREVVARSRHKKANPTLHATNLLGGDANWGEYLKPLGIGLGGLNPQIPLDFNLTLAGQPYTFEGLPWLLDRRVGPGGCVNGTCETVLEPVVPFPFSGIEPSGTQNNVPMDARNRVTTFFRFEPTVAGPGHFVLAPLPVPADSQCAAGTPRAEIVGDIGDGQPASSGGCSLAPSEKGSSNGTGAFAFGLSILGLAFASRRARKGSKK